MNTINVDIGGLGPLAQPHDIGERLLESAADFKRQLQHDADLKAFHGLTVLSGDGIGRPVLRIRRARRRQPGIMADRLETGRAEQGLDLERKPVAEVMGFVDAMDRPIARCPRRTACS